MKFIYMKIKEILIYIGIIILILVGGYLKNDQINIIEGAGTAGGNTETHKIDLTGCQEICNNDCACSKVLWKKGNAQDELHDCIIIKSDQIITDEMKKTYKIYKNPNRPDVNTRKYRKTIPGSYPKGVAEMKCWEQGLELASKQEVKEAGDGSKNLGEGWVKEGIIKITHNPSRVDYVSKSNSNVHCSTNPESICKPYLSWRPYHHRRWKNHMSIDWQGYYNNPNVMTNGTAATKDLCKYTCWKKWGKECKLIEWDSKYKRCRTSKKNLPHKEYRSGCYWNVSKTFPKPGLQT